MLGSFWCPKMELREPPSSALTGDVRVQGRQYFVNQSGPLRGGTAHPVRRWRDMDTKDALPVALAALEVCEALILTLVEKGILPQDDAIRLLENAFGAKGTAAEEEGSTAHAKA